MTDIPKILVQEEEDTAEACRDHPDIFATIHNNAGMYVNNIFYSLNIHKEINLIHIFSQNSRTSSYHRYYY